MGADLIVAVLEIDHDKAPDWNALDAWLLKLTDKDLEERHVESPSDPDEKATVDAIKAACNQVRDAYENGNRYTAAVRLSKTDVLIVGGLSWGDTPETVNEFDLFINSGAAKIAGFYE